MPKLHVGPRLNGYKTEKNDLKKQWCQDIKARPTPYCRVLPLPVYTESFMTLAVTAVFPRNVAMIANTL